MLSESNLIDMNASTSDSSALSYGHHPSADSPTNFFKMYDAEFLPPDSGNGCYGTGVSTKINGQNNSSSASSDQQQNNNYSKLIGQSDVACLQSPTNGNGHFAFNGSTAYAYQQAALIAGGSIPSSPSGYGNGSVNGGGSLFSPNPMPDSTTNFLQQQSQTFAVAGNGKPNGFNATERRSLDSTGAALFITDGSGGPKTPLGGLHVDSFYHHHQPIRSGSVSADFAFNNRFVETPKHDGATFASSETVNGGATSNGSGSQKAFVPCKVCGDKASGYHYGVTSCEGCKGFFRRSIQKQIEYRCLRDGKCMVYRLNRNRCQYCRFKKCLAVGMSRDSVRYGRVPKRSRERMQDDSRVSSCTDPEVDSELEKKQLALYDIILSVSQAHHSNCAYTDDKIKNLPQRPLHFPLDRSILTDADGLGSTELLVDQQKIIMWETLAQYTTPEIQRVVEFAKRIPNFAELMQDDQLVLIKSGFFEVWLIRIARMFNSQHCTVTFSDGSFITRDQLELIYNPELVAAMFSLSVSFNNLHLNDGEVGLFTAVVLLTPDRFGLNDPKTVEQLQEKLTEALKLQLSRSHSSDPQVFPNLLLKLSELRTVGAKHNEVLGWYRMNWRRLKLPPLYAEIYDVSKSDDLLTNGHPSSETTQCGTPLSVGVVYPPDIKPYPPDIKVPVSMMGLASNGT